MHTEPTTFSAESYFATQPSPQHLQQDVDKVRDFVTRQAKEGRSVVLVTVSACAIHHRPCLTPDPSDAERRHHRAPGAQCVSALQLTPCSDPPGAYDGPLV